MYNKRYSQLALITLLLAGCSQSGTTLKNGTFTFEPSELYQSAKSRFLSDNQPEQTAQVSDDMKAETKTSAQAYTREARIDRSPIKKANEAAEREALKVEGLVVHDTFSKKIYQNSFDDMFEKAMITVKTLGWDVMIADPQTGVLVAETSHVSMKAPFNLGTWGQDVQVMIKRLPDDEVEVIAQTKDREFGKKQNIPTFFHALQSLIQQTDAEIEQLG